MAEGAGWATEAHRACSRALVNENPSAVLAREALQEVRGAWWCVLRGGACCVVQVSRARLVIVEKKFKVVQNNFFYTSWEKVIRNNFFTRVWKKLGKS